MTISRLPSRITAVMAGAVVALVLTVALAVGWMTVALNRQAAADSGRLVATALGNALAATRALNLDYAKWDESAAVAPTGDVTWLYENTGASATVGQAFQLAVFWGGPRGIDLGWTDDGATEPAAGLLAPDVLARFEEGLARVPLASYDGVGFWAWRGDELWALAASRVEPPPNMPVESGRDAEMARLATGLRLGAAAVARVEHDLLLSGLAVSRSAPANRPSVPLLGADGTAVAFAAWTPPAPGGALLRRLLPVLVPLLAVSVAGVLAGLVLARRSARALVAAERRSAVAARTDGLTGLPNRLAFAEALGAAARAGERAVLFVDLNGFKRVNDTVGHAAGDAVVAALAARLRPLAGPRDLLARVGGDEFVFVLGGPGAGGRAAPLARAVERAVAAPVQALGHSLRLSAALGHAAQTADGTTGEDLVRQADLAMYEAKRRRAGPVAFDALIEGAAQDALAVEGALREALAAEGGFSVAYQPIVDARTGRLARAEALARWTSPRLGPVGPDRFVPVAEQAGLMGELGRRILAIVCDDLQRHPALCVSLNVSPVQLMAPSFVAELAAALAARGVAPARVEVELTEGLVVSDPKLAAERLVELRAAGFSTALDDFGTGYSSIGYLQQMGFQTLKIDRSFVSGVAGPGGRRELVGIMIRLGHVLGLRVVCEGVETDEELVALGEMGCDLLQGYRLDRPMPLGELAARWIEGAARSAA